MCIRDSYDTPPGPKSAETPGHRIQSSSACRSSTQRDATDYAECAGKCGRWLLTTARSLPAGERRCRKCRTAAHRRDHAPCAGGCGKVMYGHSQYALPAGKRMCRPCREKVSPVVECAGGCGKKLNKQATSLPAGQRTCRPCRQATSTYRVRCAGTCGRMLARPRRPIDSDRITRRRLPGVGLGMYRECRNAAGQDVRRRTCPVCGEVFTLRFAKSKQLCCGKKCSGYFGRTLPAATRCAGGCGKMMLSGKRSRPPGQRTCQQCRRTAGLPRRGVGVVAVATARQSA